MQPRQVAGGARQDGRHGRPGLSGPNVAGHTAAWLSERSLFSQLEDTKTCCSYTNSIVGFALRAYRKVSPSSFRQGLCAWGQSECSFSDLRFENV